MPTLNAESVKNQTNFELAAFFVADKLVSGAISVGDEGASRNAILEFVQPLPGFPEASEASRAIRLELISRSAASLGFELVPAEAIAEEGEA